MFYSDDLIEQIRERNDIVDVISEYISLQKKGNSHWGLCPFHNEKSPSFSVRQDWQRFKCFGCDTGGNVFTFVMKYENYSFVEAVELLAKRAGIELPKGDYNKENQQRDYKRKSILEMNKLAAQYYYAQLQASQGQQALEYLKGRELTKETMLQFGLGYANTYGNDLLKYLKLKNYSDELIRESGLIAVSETSGMYDKFRNRVMFPIMDVNNKVVGFGGRVMEDKGPKYLNSPETLVFDKSRNLYGLNRARLSRKDYFILCEGYMDVIALHQAGFTNAIASLGTAFTSGQASLIKRYVKEVYLTYDSDGAGTKAALRAVPILTAAGINAKVIKMNPYKDPDEFIKALGAEAFLKRIDGANNGFMYGLEILERDYDLNSPAGKTGFQNEVIKKLLAFEDELERNNYIEAVSKHYNIGHTALNKKISAMALNQGLAPKYERPRVLNKKQKSLDPDILAQKVLLTWCANEPEMFQYIKKFITIDDYSIPLYRDVASILYKQYEEGNLNPARILNQFPEEEQHLEVASLFHTDIQSIKTLEEKEIALQETILRIKKSRYLDLTNQLQADDIEGLEYLVELNNEIDKISSMKIKL